MHKNIKKLSLTAVLLFGLSSGASAALINLIDYEAENYFSDTISGLDWLDVTETQNRSFAEISGLFGAGAEFDGWRYATAEQFLAMIDNITTLTPPVVRTEQLYSDGADQSHGVDLLVQLFGATYIAAENDFRVFGFLDHYWYTANGDEYNVAGLIQDRDFLQSDEDRISTSATYSTQRAYSWVGSFLVRETAEIPTPATLPLLAAGLLGLLAFCRRQSSSLSLSKTNV